MSSDAGASGSAQTPAAALCQRALAGDDFAAVEVLNRLAAGDGQLMRYVSQPRDEATERVRGLWWAT